MGPVDSSGGTFLSKMQEDPRNPWLQSRSHIMYLLEAIVGKSHLRELWERHKFGLWTQEERVRCHLSKPLPVA